MNVFIPLIALKYKNKYMARCIPSPLKLKYSSVSFSKRGENVCRDEETVAHSAVVTSLPPWTLFSDLDHQPPRPHKQTSLRFHTSCLRTIWCRVRKPNHLHCRLGGEKKKKIIVAFNDFCLLLPFVWTLEWCCARTCCYGNPQVVSLSSTCFSTVSALLPASISPISMRLALCGKWVMWALSQNRLGLGSAFGTPVVPLPSPPRNNQEEEEKSGRRITEGDEGQKKKKLFLCSMLF